MSRYVQHSDQDRRAMLGRLGLSRVEDLWQDLPQDKVLKEPLDLPAGLSELEVVGLLKDRARENADPDALVSFLGGGIYDHFVPAVVPWVISRPEFATAYTPYQAEVSQGTLQSIYEFQTLVCRLTAMDVANASVYDGASAVAEAALAAVRITRRRTVAVSGTVHPHHRAVLDAYARGGRMDVATIPAEGGMTDPGAVRSVPDPACVIVQNPNFFGLLESLPDIAESAKALGALSVVSCDPVSLSVLAPPGDVGADIAVGEGQGLGIPPSFGGPLLGFFACRERFLRQMPGRVVGRTVDEGGKPCFVMTLQTREQHIRREKSTSNICTNQALMALAATVYLSAVGEAGFTKVGELCVRKSHYAAERICREEGFSLGFDGPFFKEFVLRCPVEVDALLKALGDEKILGGIPLGPYRSDLEDCLLVAVTEKRTRREIDRWAESLARAAHTLRNR